MFTPKQERNGATGEVATHNSAQPGPDWSGDISSLKGHAESVGAYRFGQQTHDDIFVTPFGTGVSGGEYANPGGSMWDWDGGLAIGEMPGEWSQPDVTANSSPNANTPSNVSAL